MVEGIEDKTVSKEKSTITLVSEDGKQFEINVEAAKGSTHLSHFMEGGDPSMPMPLPKVKSHVLEKIVEYLEYYKNRKPKEIHKPLPNLPFTHLVDEWDAKFISLENRLIFELMLGANYLDIPGLLDLCGAKIAVEIRSKSVAEIRKAFNIKNDFTPEEEAQIREENRWCDPTE